MGCAGGWAQLRPGALGRVCVCARARACVCVCVCRRVDAWVLACSMEQMEYRFQARSPTAAVSRNKPQ